MFQKYYIYGTIIWYYLWIDKSTEHFRYNRIKCSTFVIKAHIVLVEPLLECDGHRRYRYDLLPSAPGG